MVLDRVKQVAQHLSGRPPHPFDPLSEAEIEQAVSFVRHEHGSLFYNAITLWEPRKAEMLSWLANPDTDRPHRVADVVAIGKGSKVYDGLVDLTEGVIVKWELLDGVQPLVRFFSRRGHANRVTTEEAATLMRPFAVRRHSLPIDEQSEAKYSTNEHNVSATDDW